MIWLVIGIGDPGTTAATRTVGWIPNKRIRREYVERKPTFSRKYWEELKAAEAAEKAARRAARRAKDDERKGALQEAALAANEAIEAAERHELAAKGELQRLTAALNAAAQAKSLAAAVAQAHRAVHEAAMLRAAIEQDEEEAIMLLLH